MYFVIKLYSCLGTITQTAESDPAHLYALKMLPFHELGSACWICYKSDHKALKCGGGNKCFKCLSSNHMQRECSVKYPLGYCFACRVPCYAHGPNFGTSLCDRPEKDQLIPLIMTIANLENVSDLIGPHCNANLVAHMKAKLREGPQTFINWMFEKEDNLPRYVKFAEAIYKAISQ